MALDKKTLYEAKVLKILESDSGWHYYIHYNRWARHYYDNNEHLSEASKNSNFIKPTYLT